MMRKFEIAMQITARVCASVWASSDTDARTLMVEELECLRCINPVGDDPPPEYHVVEYLRIEDIHDHKYWSGGGGI